MSVEWDEELIAGLESGLHNCGSDECQMRQKAVRIARAEHTARLEAEAERDALAEKVKRIEDWACPILSPGPPLFAQGYDEAQAQVRAILGAEHLCYPEPVDPSKPYTGYSVGVKRDDR